MSSNNKVGAALVIGGGIGGIQASLDLAELGFKVYLVEKNPSIGGIMAQLDKTFPTNDCSLCILAPKMVEVFRHPNIKLYSYSEVESITGKPGNFTADILKKARYVKEDICVNCGLCVEKCPMRVKDEFDRQLRKRKAIYMYYLQGVPAVMTIDKKNCLWLTKKTCRLCEQNCDRNAIDLNQRDENIKLNVGAIILALGANTFDPLTLPQYGYSEFKNVITSIEFERILNASGPFKGKILRPSDRKEPKKVLWLNCIGSRNISINKNYCSSVCCMYSIKQSVIAKEHIHDLDCRIFFIDMRTVGKGFEEFYLRAQKMGIKFLKGRVTIIKEDPKTSNLIVTYENIETGKIEKEIFDLIVLSIGLTPSNYTINLSKKLGINLNKYDFCSTDVFTPLQTNKPGIYVCGTYSGPKDIAETVAEASAAAGRVSSLLFTERNTLITAKKYPPELSIEDQEPRIGIFICHCGVNIGGVINISEVVEFAENLPNVVYTEENMYSCSQDTQDKLKKKIIKYKLNRIVVASCTPRTHEILFQTTIREAGLNPYLFEFVNIREQCSWVHMSEPKKATEKAKELVFMGVAKAKLLKPIPETYVEVTHSALIIGGGISGMTAALELANQGFEVYLIEREKKLGGLVKNIHYLIDGGRPQEYLDNIIKQIKNHNKIKCFMNAQIKDIQGFVGNFSIIININSKINRIKSGVIIVATGGIEYKPKEFMYGKDKRILTQLELEQKIVANELSAENVVMIQCVGSRNEERPNCSRICCTSAMKNALKLKELNPHINVFILHKDIRTYGFKEDYYREARGKGVIFIRYDKKFEPEVSIINDNLMVSINDSLLNDKIIIKPDLVVLSATFLPTENKELSQILKVPLEKNGFFLEAHVKLRPLDFAKEGIFLCGSAQWPKFINESIVQAKGAAARAATILSKQKVNITGSIAEIEENKCIGCGECRDICIYQAIEMVETLIEFNAIRDSIEPYIRLTRYKSRVLPAMCKGCGTCISVCPVEAISLKHFTNQQLIDMIKSILR